MVDIEHRPLSTLQKNLAPLIQCSPDKQCRVHDIRCQNIMIPTKLCKKCCFIRYLDTHNIKNRTILFKIVHDLCRQFFGMMQFPDPVSYPGDLVSVSRPDTFAGRTDRFVTLHTLFCLIDQRMIGKQEMRLVRNKESPFQVIKLLHFNDEIFRRKHHSISYNIFCLRVQYTGGNQMKCVLFITYDDCVPGIVATGKSTDIVMCLRHMIDNFPFSFISPLESYDQVRSIHLSAHPYFILYSF